MRWEGGRIVEVAAGRAERHYADSVILPGFVNAHSHLEYAVYRGLRRRHAVRTVARGPTSSASGRLGHDDMVAIARCGVADSLRAGITTTADYSFSGAAAIAAAELGLRATVYLEVFADDPEDAPAGASRRSGRWSRRRRSSRSASHRTRRTPAPSRPTAGACRSASPSARTWRRARPRTSGWSTEPGHSTGDSDPRRRRRANAAVAHARPRCSARISSVRTASTSRPTEIALLQSEGVPVAHCPRSNALLGCGVAPMTAMRAAGMRGGARHGLAGVDTVVRRLRGDARSRLCGARALERRPDALVAADALGSPRATRPALCESTIRWVP